jgi:hypothetical protein
MSEAVVVSMMRRSVETVAGMFGGVAPEAARGSTSWALDPRTLSVVSAVSIERQNPG